MSAFREALAPLAARMPRSAREREILRVAAEVPGADAFAAAQALLLRWAREQAGMELPPEAGQGESFEQPAGGRSVAAIRLEGEDVRLWALRSERPDDDVPGRSWTTEAVLGAEPGGPVRLSARVLASSGEAEIGALPAVPRFLDDLARAPGLATDGVALPERIGEAQAGVLAGALDHPGRRLPIIAISTAEDGSLPLEPAPLRRRLLGLAHVVALAPEASWRLTERYGRMLSCWHGAVRWYRPGFDAGADPYRHRLVLGWSLVTPEERQRIEAWLRQEAAAESLVRLALGREVLRFADVREAAARARNADLVARPLAAGAEAAQLREQVARLAEEVATLKRRIEEQDAVFEDFALRERAQGERIGALEAQLRAARETAGSLRAELRRRGASGEVDDALPGAWGDAFLDWADRVLEGRVVLEPAARRALRAPAFADPARAASCLLWLAGPARDSLMRRAQMPLRDALLADGVRNAPCGADAFEIRGGHDPVRADWHVKNGGNTRDPALCLRIYWGWDARDGVIRVAEMPGHRRTGAT